MRLVHNGEETKFGYDSFGNLAEACYTGSAEKIYKLPDALGNLYKSHDKKDYTYSAGGQLLEDPEYSYGYNSEGFLIEKTAKKATTKRFSLLDGDNKPNLCWHYQWYANGRLKKAYNNDGVHTEYTYDALGRRTAKIDLAKKVIHRYVYDGNVLLHEFSYNLKDVPGLEVSPKGKVSYTKPENIENIVTWVFEEGTFVPQAKITNEGTYGIISDYLGTPIQAFDENGEQVWERELDIYGKVKRGDSKFVPFLYQGQYYDEETDLAYNRFRYYSPESGTFISQDPIGLLSGEPNFYAYVHDSNAWVDPLGLSGRGGTIHQGIQNSLENNLGKQYGIKNVTSEGRIPLSNDLSRFGDVVVRDPISGKITEVHQVGDMRSRDGFRPSARERGAIMDIRETLGDDVKIVFHDKKGKVTLINPDLQNDWRKPSSKHRKLKGGCHS